MNPEITCAREGARASRSAIRPSGSDTIDADVIVFATEKPGRRRAALRNEPTFGLLDAVAGHRAVYHHGYARRRALFHGRRSARSTRSIASRRSSGRRSTARRRGRSSTTRDGVSADQLAERGLVRPDREHVAVDAGRRHLVDRALAADHEPRSRAAGLVHARRRAERGRQRQDPASHARRPVAAGRGPAPRERARGEHDETGAGGADRGGRQVERRRRPTGSAAAVCATVPASAGAAACAAAWERGVLVRRRGGDRGRRRRRVALDAPGPGRVGRHPDALGATAAPAIVTLARAVTIVRVILLVRIVTPSVGTALPAVDGDHPAPARRAPPWAGAVDPMAGGQGRILPRGKAPCRSPR